MHAHVHAPRLMTMNDESIMFFKNVFCFLFNSKDQPSSGRKLVFGRLPLNCSSAVYTLTPSLGNISKAEKFHNL